MAQIDLEKAVVAICLEKSSVIACYWHALIGEDVALLLIHKIQVLPSACAFSFPQSMWNNRSATSDDSADVCNENMPDIVSNRYYFKNREPE